MQRLVVGDIQGCYKGLCKLLKKAKFDPNKDKLYAVGDLIARGEDSKSTVDLLRDLGGSFQTVLGNHDLHFLAISQGLKPAKPSDRLGPLLKHKKLNDVVNWLRQFPLALQVDDNTLLTHAGLYPRWSFTDAITYSNAVQRELMSDQWQMFLQRMYGNYPDYWYQGMPHADMLRFAVNSFTRMRFIDQQGHLEFKTKTAPSRQDFPLRPWFTAYNPYLKPEQRVVFGHWAALLGKTSSLQFIGLDTGYVWGNSLTALRLEDNKIISISAK